MAKVKLFVCENYSPEFADVCQKNGWTDISVIPFPCMCVSKARKQEAAGLMAGSGEDGSQGVLICSKRCDMSALIPAGADMATHTSDDCFSHLASGPFINYILAKGGYIIGSGWLMRWRERIAQAGFDRDTAIRFYHDFCRELVFFDAGVCPDAEKDLIELSLFLELPYVIVPIEPEGIRLMIENAVSQYKPCAIGGVDGQSVADVQAQCAEYAAIFDLVGRIAAYANKRDVIEKVKEIFVMVFGARQFKYWNNDYDKDGLQQDIKAFMADEAQEYLLLQGENRFCIKIRWHEKFFGVIDVSGFMFPQYIEKYLNFALEIVKICGLVFSNNEQYEKLLKSEQDMRYSSTHDVLTGLYNRTYIHELLNQQTQTVPFTVFVFDIDHLKFVNDMYGHAEGDKLIIKVAALLKKCFRDTDILARTGGDEFVAILHGIDRHAADIIMQRIKQQLESHNSARQDTHLKISFSVGCAVGQRPDDTVEAMMKNADELMYIDKMNKRVMKI